MFVDNMVTKRTTQHAFEIDEVPRFLSEEMAIAYARKALSIEGFDEGSWEPRAEKEVRTTDPNGRPDKYSTRNSLNPNRVSMIFLNKAEKNARCVDVEMQDKRIVCAVTIPK
jgi:hypothetical protein